MTLPNVINNVNRNEVLEELSVECHGLLGFTFTEDSNLESIFLVCLSALQKAQGKQTMIDKIMNGKAHAS